MYNDKSAKDLLAQYPKRMAEGGAATQEPMPPQRAAPLVAPNLVGDVGGTGGIAPVVANRPKLTPLDQLSVSPSTLSYSQQMARDRAAKQELLNSVLAQSSAPIDALKKRDLLQQVYKGDINAENINEKILYPMYEERVRNAYNLIGRSGTAIPENTYLDQLKAGTISGADFQNKFLTDVANYAGADKFEATQLASINKARTALGLPLLEAPKPKIRSGNNFFGSGGTGSTAGTNNKGLSGIAGRSLSFLKPAATPAVVTPVDFGGPAPTQLFAEGGEVNKKNEKEQDFSSMTEEDRMRLAAILEQRAVQDARVDLGPLSAALVPSSKRQGMYDVELASNLYGIQPFADVDLKDKKISRLGARLGGDSPLGNYELQYALDPETRQPVITGVVRKQLSPTSDISAQGTYVPVRGGDDYYNAGVRYTKQFAEGGEVTPVQHFRDGSGENGVSQSEERAKMLRLMNEIVEFNPSRKDELTKLEALGGMPISPDYYANADALIVEKAGKKDLKEYDKRIADQAKGTNTGADPSRYIRKSSPLFPFEGRLTASGWIHSDAPDQVHVGANPDKDLIGFIKGLKATNPEMQPAFDRIGNKNDLDTLVHEMTHSNQIREAFLGDKDYERARRIRQRYMDEIDLQNLDRKSRYVNPMSGSGLDERELGAYLKAYEGLHPSAKTVSGKDAVIPFERTYLGRKVLPPATGLMKLLEDMGSFGPLSELKDPATREYVDKMMGRTKRKPTPKKFEKGGEVQYFKDGSDESGVAPAEENTSSYMDKLAQVLSGGSRSSFSDTGYMPTPSKQRGIGENIVGAGETALTLASAVPSVIPGIAGMAGLYNGKNAEERFSKGMQSIIYQPRTKAGQEMLESTSQALEPLAAIPPIAEVSALSRLKPVAGAPVFPEGKRVAGAVAKGASTVAKAGAKEIAKQIETGTGIVGRNTIDPRMYLGAYHGSPKDFDKFDMNAPKNTKGGLNKHGVFLSTEKEVGVRYAEDAGKDGILYKVEADVKKPLNLTATQYEKLQSIVGKLDENKKLNEFEQMSLEDLLGPIGWDMKQHPIEAIKKAGYDSITKSKGKFGVAESELMVFDPNRLQILDKTPVGTKSEFKMTDLPSGDKPREVYKIPRGTLLYHGAHGDRAKEIIGSGSSLKARTPYKSSGGTIDEGGLIWMGDKDTATAFADSKADPFKVALERQKTGVERAPGQVFTLATDKPLKLIPRWYELTKKEADALNEALGLPEYKHLQKGYTTELAASRAHGYMASNVERYKVEGVGEISSPWPIILRTLKADGFYDGSGVALAADTLPVSPIKKKHGGEVTDFIKSKK